MIGRWHNWPAKLAALIAAVATLLFSPLSVYAQTLTTGAIAGDVTDPTGATVPNATVAATNMGTGEVRTTATGTAGHYIVSQLTPGDYKVSAAASGFQTQQKGPITVRISQTMDVNFKLEIGKMTETVEVTSGAALIQTQNPNTTTTVGATQIADLPNPGMDLSYVAQVAPGAVMNTGINSGGGSGNVEFNGLPAVSNNFTVDGLDDNTSGATNLLLGLNAVQEATVNTLSYSADQGRQGAAQVNFVSKSGSNQWHGNAFETWNGSHMNAANWFHNAAPGPACGPANNSKCKPFSNVNQFGGSVGGPILKNKLFVFGDIEGIRIALPSTQTVNYPSAAFESFTLSQIPRGVYDPANGVTYDPAPNPNAAISYYKQAFALYGSPSGGVPIATPDCPLGTDASTGLPALPLAPGNPTPHGDGCALYRVIGLSNNTHDLFIKTRVDHNMNDDNHVWYAFGWERGVQASYTDPVNPVFNAYSTQPFVNASVGYTHTFSPTLVNDFDPGFLWYSGIFQPTDFAKARAASPFEFEGANFTPIFGAASEWPAGSGATNWQLIDNLTWVRGTHAFKFGENLRRTLISDHNLGSGTTPLLHMGDLAQYSADVVGGFAQWAFPSSTSEPLGLVAFDAYAQDTWKARPALTLTCGLRATWNSNPVSQHNNFARLTGSFYDIPHDVNQPLNQVIQTGLRFMLADTQTIVWQPRAALAWQARPGTLFRVGAGFFSDALSGGFADSILQNFPNKNLFYAGAASAGLPIVATYGIPGSGSGVTGDPNNDALTAISAANQAAVAGFASGVLSCAATVAPPNCVPGQAVYTTVPKGVFKYPYFAEWGATLQHEFRTNWLATVQYVGTKATNLPYAEQADGYQTVCQGCFAPYLYSPTFRGPDGRFGFVHQYWAGANSSYNALQASVQKRMSHGLTFRVNYTWSHCIDTNSNEGAVSGSFNSQSIIASTPGRLFELRGNCDYDVRHSLNASYVYQLPSPAKNRFLKQIINGWQVSGDLFLRTGFPFSVYSWGYSANGNGVFQSAPAPNFAVPVNGASPYARFAKLQPCGQANTNPTQPCQSPGVAEIQWLNPNAFTSVVDPNTGSCTAGETFGSSGKVLSTNDNASTCQFGAGGRNNVFGPGFAWADIFVSKYFNITERVTFRFDAQFYNAFNHANFNFPCVTTTLACVAGIPGVGSTLNDAYTITSTVSPPTSLLGPGLGGDNSVRMIAISGRVEF